MSDRIDGIMEMITILAIILVFAYMFKFFISQPTMIGGGECVDADCKELFWGFLAECNKKPNMECIKIKYKGDRNVTDDV